MDKFKAWLEVNLDGKFLLTRPEGAPYITLLLNCKGNPGMSVVVAPSVDDPANMVAMTTYTMGAAYHNRFNRDALLAMLRLMHQKTTVGEQAASNEEVAAANAWMEAERARDAVIYGGMDGASP